MTRVLAAPGNAGIATIADCFPEVSANDVAAVVNLVDQQAVDLTVVGPEEPLVGGLADALRDKGRLVFGPSAAAARIEGSKAYAKEVMGRAGVATARSRLFHPGQEDEAVSFVEELGGRAVVKEDGLASGKGVTLVHSVEGARGEIDRDLIGEPSIPRTTDWLIEEMLEGPEISAFALSDGERIVPLGLCQDQKRAWIDGPMTGGMGAYSPLGWVEPAVEASIWDDVVRPVAQEMADEGAPFVGVLFAGLMLTSSGIRVLEFNCRFGDPETQALLPRLRSSLAEALEACAAGDLSKIADRAWRRSDRHRRDVQPRLSGRIPLGRPDPGNRPGQRLGGRHCLPVWHCARSRRTDRHCTRKGALGDRRRSFARGGEETRIRRGFESPFPRGVRP